MIKEIRLERKTSNILAKVFGSLSLIGLITSVLFGYNNIYRLVESYLTAYVFNLSIVLGSLFFILIMYLTQARWSVVIRRIPEAISGNFVLMALLFLPLFLGLEHLYHWMQAGAVEHDHLLQIKAPYLNKPFFLIRLVIYLTVWHYISKFYVKNSRRQDITGDVKITKKLQNKAALSILLYALTITFAGFDLLMSIESHWFSTIFGVYFFAISILLFLCILSLITILMYKNKTLENYVKKSHIHDVGKLLFGFIIFWAYIAFSQYFLIWYANIPEETFWYLKRASETWKPISYVLVIGHFIIPFFILMSKHVKKFLPVHLFMIVLLIIMSYLDIYYIIMPAFHKQFNIHLLDISTLIFTTSTLAYFTLKNIEKYSLIPFKDPRIKASTELDTH